VVFLNSALVLGAEKRTKTPRTKAHRQKKREKVPPLTSFSGYLPDVPRFYPLSSPPPDRLLAYGVAVRAG
jgi:hypothetical protein